MKKSTMILLSAVLLAWGCGRNSTFKLGYVETEEVDVAAKIPGRVLEIKVQEGDRVRKGDVLMVLQSDDIKARVEQARAGLEAAEAQLRMARNGARVEERRMVERQYDIAIANMQIMQQTHERILKVFNEGGISVQEKDTSEFRLRVAKEQFEQAKAQLDMVRNGVRREQIDALEAQVKAMREKVNEAVSYLDETMLRAPLDGEVKAVNSRLGEVVTPGFAVVTMLEPRNYVIFNLKEDEFRGLKIGDTLAAEIPALNSNVKLQVYYIAGMADFAKYESTAEKGSWDVKSFEVRCRIQPETGGTRPGMSVKIHLQ